MLRVLQGFARASSRGTISAPAVAGLQFSCPSRIEGGKEAEKTRSVAQASSHRQWMTWRGFASGPTEPLQPPGVAEANSILHRIDSAHFQEILRSESDQRWNMPYSELLQLCVESGAASSSEEAEEICQALDRSGVVLRIKNLVYLRPMEVAEIIYQALPDTDQEVRKRLQQLRSALAPLEAEKRSIDRHAHRVSRLVLWGGLGVMITQWTLFARLTFWELSWDVMEPVTYFTASAFGLCAYAYCLWYNEEFGFVAARERIHGSLQDRSYMAKGFDKDRYDVLQRRISRLERSLSLQGPLKHENNSRRHVAAAAS